MIGRSNLQQAIPITFGYKMAGLLSAIERHRTRLAQLRPRVLVASSPAPAGTLASLATGAMETQAGLMEELGLGQPDIAWHTIRDNIAEVGCFLGLVGGTLGKLSMDVKLMMQTRSARSTSRSRTAAARAARCRKSAIRSAAATSTPRSRRAPACGGVDGRDVADHERSTGPWEIEWIVLPEAFCLMAGALKQARFVLEGLEVDAAQMRANIDMTGGLVMSEAVMMASATTSVVSTRTTWSTTSVAWRSRRSDHCSICCANTRRSTSTWIVQHLPSCVTPPTTSGNPA